MTIQEQLIKLNGLFKKLHNDFASLSTEKNNLDAKYNTLVGALDNKYQSERDRINDQKEEVLKYYRIAKDNSNKELKTKVCQTHDEIFVSSFSVQHKNFVFRHLLKYTKTV